MRPANHRRARVARVLAKQPRPVEVEVEYAPEPGAREQLLDLLLELLDQAGHSGAG